MEHVRLAVVQLELRLPPVIAEYADAVYPVIAEPPFDDGANQLTVTAVCPASTATCCGEDGAEAGVAEVADEAALVPIALTARSFTEYAVPFVSPLTVNVSESVPASVQLVPPLVL